MSIDRISAFAELIYRNPEISARLKRLAPSGESAEDFLQNVYVRFWQRLRSAPDKPFATAQKDAIYLLLRIARDLRTDVIRRHGKSITLLASARYTPGVIRMEEERENPATFTLKTEWRSLITSGLLRLPENLRWTILQHVVHGRALSDMAEERGIRQSTVKSWFQRAKKQLRLAYSNIAA